MIVLVVMVPILFMLATVSMARVAVVVIVLDDVAVEAAPPRDTSALAPAAFVFLFIRCMVTMKMSIRMNIQLAIAPATQSIL